MKNKHLLRASLAGLLLLIVALPASAYIGLCCAKCGGNMPMNILGGGIPETNEFRFKISPMYMRMDGLRDGTSNVHANDILGMPVDMMGKPTGKYMYDNKRDYRLGDEFRLDGYAMYQFKPNWLLQAQLNGEYKGDIDGEMNQFADGRSGHVMQGNAKSPAATPLAERGMLPLTTEDRELILAYLQENAR